jgi:hypothetical protein
MVGWRTAAGALKDTMIPSSKIAGSLSLVALQAVAVAPCLVTLFMSVRVIDIADVLIPALPALLVLAVFSWMRLYLVMLVSLLVVSWSTFWTLGNIHALEHSPGLYVWFVILLVLLPSALSLVVAGLCLQHLRAVRQAA